MRHDGLDRPRARWFLGGRAHTVKSWDVDQVVLRPPSVQDRVPAGHLAHVVRDLGRASRDVSVSLRVTTEDRGGPPSAPTLLVAVRL